MKKYIPILALGVLLLFVGCTSKQAIVSPRVQDKPAPNNIKTIVKSNNSENMKSKNNSNAQVKKEPVTTPVLIDGYYIGGRLNGKWLSRFEFYNKKNTIFNGFEYDVYVQDKKVGIAKGALPSEGIRGEVLKEKKYDENYPFVNLRDKSNNEVEYDIAIKANWNLFPHQYVKLNTNNSVYENIVKNALKKMGLKNPKTTIKQLIKTDLNGDGVEEVLIRADNTKKGDWFDEWKKGDNAIVIFRSVKNGVANEQVIYSYINKNETTEYFDYWQLFNIKSIADIDGDGIMEVIIQTKGHEYGECSVYKFKNNKLELLEENGWGV